MCNLNKIRLGLAGEWLTLMRVLQHMLMLIFLSSINLLFKLVQTKILKSIGFIHKN